MFDESRKDRALGSILGGPELGKGSLVLLAGVVAISLFIGMRGCAQSNFELMSDSRLPRWVTLPAGMKREDVSIWIDYMLGTVGPDYVRMRIRDHSGHDIVTEKGISDPGHQEIVEFNGIKERLILNSGGAGHFRVGDAPIPAGRAR